MRCYNCGCELSEHSFCTNCGVDVTLYKKIIRTSNYFYNQGLERAKVRDLSGAIVSLRESLKFNKNNIKARNLLGLVYFELGEVPAALAEWVISKNIRPKKNMAADYLDLLQSSSSELETINGAIKKYNIALDACQSVVGVDTAVIQLKQALRANPKFLRAHQLLALCSMQRGEYGLAKKEIERARAIDVNNTLTLRYAAEIERLLNPEVSKKKKDKNSDGPSTITYVNDENQLIIQPVAPKDNKGSNTVLNLICGIAVGFAITFFLVLPARVQQEKATAQESIKVYGTQLDAKNLTITELESTVSDQENKIATLTESLKAYAGTEGTLLSMENLLKASAIYLENPENFLEVADYISEVDETTWTEDTSENYKRLYEALKAAIGPRVAASYYAEGVNAIKESQYADAIAYLEAAVKFDAQNADALLQLGNAYQVTEKKDAATTTFNKVIELFPDSWQAGRAETALKKMN